MDEPIVAAADAARRPLNSQQAEELVIATITRHADAVLRTARRHSLCADDAQDAYQRALEILLRHAHRLDPERAGSWLHTVVKHEAMAVRRSRVRLVGAEEVDLDAMEAVTTSSPEERVLQFEHMARSAEALKRLKPQEARALWLKAAGNSYREICDITGWTYTKVNRCLTEGRRGFLERYAGIEAGEECLRWQPILSAMVDGEATGDQLVELRPHLRNCGACRATVRELHSAETSLGLLFPPAVVTLTATDLERAGGFLTRLHETVSMTLHERAASTILRAQTVIEAATPQKAAAIAASAVAVAGGGLAVDEARNVGRPAAPVATQATSRPASPLRTTRSAPARSTSPQVRATRPTTVGPAPEPQAHTTEIDRAQASAREPLVDPVESRALSPVATARATTSTKPKLATPTAPPTSPTSREFGFETP